MLNNLGASCVYFTLGELFIKPTTREFREEVAQFIDIHKTLLRMGHESYLSLEKIARNRWYGVHIDLDDLSIALKQSVADRSMNHHCFNVPC